MGEICFQQGQQYTLLSYLVGISTPSPRPSPFLSTSYPIGPISGWYYSASIYQGRSGHYCRIIGKTLACQKVGNKSKRKSGVFHFREISRGPWFGACQEISFLKWRVSNCFWPLLPPKTEAPHLVGLSGFWRKYISHLSVLLWPIY